MGKIVLLAVAAAWAAVLLPPLLRSRLESRPGSSVTDFRRQLSTLQRAVPTRSMSPMRSMARPLAPSPLQRPAAPARPSHSQRTHLDRAHLDGIGGADRDRLGRAPERYGDERPGRRHGEIGYTGELARRYDRQYRLDHTGEHPAHRTTHLHRASHRELVRRRRANVLFVLVMATAATLFLAATMKSSVMVYAFALSFVSLCGYCYKLAQLRQYESDRSGRDTAWYRAA